MVSQNSSIMNGFGLIVEKQETIKLISETNFIVNILKRIAVGLLLGDKVSIIFLGFLSCKFIKRFVDLSILEQSLHSCKEPIYLLLIMIYFLDCYLLNCLIIKWVMILNYAIKISFGEDKAMTVRLSLKVIETSLLCNQLLIP